MLGSEAYRGYVHEHHRLRALIAAIDRMGAGSEQELALRGTAVLVCAEFEAFLRNLRQDQIDGTVTAWDGMLPAQKMTVAAQIVVEFMPHAVAGPEAITGAKIAERVASTVRRAASWLDTPGQFARDGINPTLRDLHEPDNVARGVERALLHFRADGMKFFDWLGSQGVDAEASTLSLRALVALRSDVAHQLGQGSQPTSAELRTYQRSLGRLLRCILAYCRAAPPGTWRSGVT